MTERHLREGLPPLPERMKSLHVDARGFPVPWFVEWVDGEPKFQIVDATKAPKAIKHKLCWLCGKPMGTFKAFLIGPMCGVNRVSAEPPSHRDCAEFAVKACPFLSRPLAQRTDRGIEEIDDLQEPAGVMIKRNPGVTLLWITKDYQTFRAPNGTLIKIGDPVECIFYREGRKATKAEIDESVSTGLPFLMEPAEQEGPRAVAALNRMLTEFRQIVEQAA